MLVLTLVFGTIMRFSKPYYSIFLLSMLLPWTFFSQCLAYSVESIVGNGELLKKVRVAKLVFPVAAVVSNIINLPFFDSVVLAHHSNAVSSTLDVDLLAGAHPRTISIHPGRVVFLCNLNVFYRDVSHIVQIILSAWFYFSPVIYSLTSSLPNTDGFFSSTPCCTTERISPQHLLRLTALVAFSCHVPGLWCGCSGVGFAVFRRYEKTFVYYVLRNDAIRLLQYRI